MCAIESKPLRTTKPFSVIRNTVLIFLIKYLLQISDKIETFPDSPCTVALLWKGTHHSSTSQYLFYIDHVVLPCLTHLLFWKSAVSLPQQSQCLSGELGLTPVLLKARWVSVTWSTASPQNTCQSDGRDLAKHKHVAFLTVMVLRPQVTQMAVLCPRRTGSRGPLQSLG